MFYVSYALAELRRRKSRTILTALGLAVGVALVVVVNAVSTGLDDAQRKVLEPLTGVGTDMSVTRPLKVSQNGQLSQSQQNRFRRLQGGGPGLQFQKLKPGQKVNVDTFTAAGQLTFSQARVKQISAISGVSGAAGSLTLSDIHISGKAPKITGQQQNGGGFGGTPPSGGGAGGFGNSSLKFQSRTITGVDQTHPDIAALTPSQIVKGTYFISSGGDRQAVLSQGYAHSQNLHVGSKVTLGGKTFTVVGIAGSPLGGTASDAYVELTTLQKLADLKGQVNTVQVRATDTGAVDSVAASIKTTFKGSSVTTASDLANRVGGSLSDARSLSSKLGTALEILGLVAAVLIACLLTLASVSKRVREIGTLKALGWTQWTVVRQISGESVLQGALGGVIGALVGLAGAAAVNAYGWTLKATVAGASQSTQNGFGGGPPGGGGGFGLGQAADTVTSGSSLVKITTSPDARLIIAAITLAVLGGLVAGAVGGLRAARLRPAAALRTVE